ncbi:hypothetical protein LD120_00411 [Mesoplasma sp. JKS002657]|nr:hypothetical protein [Mesoplasma sp. JKS002661]MCL8216153.1 hypothetical protein [Mesoplasma sp. JKS002657]
MSSGVASTVGCADDQNNVFVLKSDIGEVIDSFNKRDVVDYYFENWGYSDPQVTVIVVNFKVSGLKNYGQKPGGIDFFLNQLIRGLNMKPDQKKYDARDIPSAVWQNAGWWDYNNSQPRDLREH